MRLLIWISVGSQQVRRGLKCYSKLDREVDFGRKQKKREREVQKWGLGAGAELEFASKAQVSSISVRHHRTRHLMFSIFPQCSSPSSIPSLLLFLSLSLRSGSQSGPTGPGE